MAEITLEAEQFTLRITATKRELEAWKEAKPISA